MFLFRQRIKGLSVKNDLFDGLPKLPSDEVMSDLAARYRAGDDLARETIILSLMRLAISIACQYAVTKPNHADDFVAIANLTVVEAVNEVKSLGPDENLVGFVVAKVHDKISRAWSATEIINVPKATYYVKKKQDGEYQCPKRVKIRDYPKDPGSILEIREILGLSIFNESERRVISMREDLYNDREIAEALGISISMVGVHKNRVAARFEQMEHE